jgi:hypothetical protein
MLRLVAAELGAGSAPELVCMFLERKYSPFYLVDLLKNDRKCSMHGRDKWIETELKEMKRRTGLEETVIDGRVILKWIKK